MSRPDRAAERLGLVLSVANTLAVADELPRAEPDSIRRSLEKAVLGIDLGLAELARRSEQNPIRSSGAGSSRATMKACTASPQSGCGTPTTAAAWIRGCSWRTSSTSEE